jgi:NadR type nicotinamide-nucleotide adenylyltransferase
MRFAHGLVIGKFDPPHRGHKLLIDRAAAEARRVTVMVCAKPADSVPGELRAEWLREIHPGVEVQVVDDREDEQDVRIWAENTVRRLGGAPDAVFSSEEYGAPFARLMGSASVLVDPQRTAVACSGTAIRRDPFACWEFLEPPVRAWFARRVCVLGAESTGTTTLAAALAQHYGTVCVPEYGRELTEIKTARGDLEWRSDDFVHVAEEQNRREDAAARLANRVVILDTNSFATILWHRRYMGAHDERVARIAAGRRCDLYLLTGDEIPFVADGMRDGEHIRHEMHGWFVEALRSQATPWLLLSGSPDERLAKAVRAVDTLPFILENPPHGGGISR